jgi:DNA-directed RNA polymerase subunit RPC12/RpoP
MQKSYICADCEEIYLQQKLRESRASTVSTHGLAHSHIHVRHMAMQQQQGSNTLHHLKRAPPPSREETQQIVYPVAIFVLFSNFSYVWSHMQKSYICADCEEIYRLQQKLRESRAPTVSCSMRNSRVRRANQD